MNITPRQIGQALLGLTLALGGSGCASLQYGCDLPAVPAHRVPPEVLGRPRSEMQQLSIARLRQQPPEVYQLGPGDILGVYIPFVLGTEEEAPPVHFPEQGDQPPALGYPIPIREDGTLTLPLIPPVKVEGLSLAQATDRIRNQYITSEILKEGQEKIVVTMLRRRMYRVSVIREEGGAQEGITKRGTGATIDLPAYENDVLHALNETGGLPGLDAKNEIYILRGGHEDAAQRDALIAQLAACRNPCDCPFPPPADENVVIIPIRYYPENVPQFTEADVILKTGDIIYIPARDRERFYTGGVLRGGEHLIPRDYDLDVLGAIAISGGTLGAGNSAISGIGQVGGAGFGGGGGGNQRGPLPPTNLIVLRKLPCGGQLPITVNVNRALVDPSHRILVQPEDTLILKYRLEEEVVNTLLGLFQINYLLGAGLNN